MMSLLRSPFSTAKRGIDAGRARRASSPTPRVRRDVLFGLFALTLGSLASPAPALADEPTEVSDTLEGYELLYALDIPVNAPFNVTPPDYTVDASAETTFPFDRVAYRMVLERDDGTQDTVVVSLEAFTNDPTMLGVPARSTGANFQQYVYDREPCKCWCVPPLPR